MRHGTPRESHAVWPLRYGRTRICSRFRGIPTGRLPAALLIRIGDRTAAIPERLAGRRSCGSLALARLRGAGVQANGSGVEINLPPLERQELHSESANR